MASSTTAIMRRATLVCLPREDWNFCRCAHREEKMRAARMLLMGGSPFGEDCEEDANSMELVAVDLEQCFVTS